LEAGIKAAQSSRQETNLVLLLSDGRANVGETDLEKVGQRAYEAREKGITTSALGVGGNYNEALMSEVGLQGGGRFYHLRHAHQIVPYVAGELGEVSALAARETALHLTLPSGTGLEPFSTAYKIAAQSLVNLGDIPVDTHLEVVIRILLPPQPADSRLSIEGRLSYLSPADNKLATPLNTVTLRFVVPETYDRRESAVVPVVERVLNQMQARDVLHTLRTDAILGRVKGDKERDLSVAHMRSYASLLGDDAAKEYALRQDRVYRSMAAAPMAAKRAAYDAHAVQRSTKAHDQDERKKKDKKS
jgi:Ca-activated chloride channel family protein